MRIAIPEPIQKKMTMWRNGLCGLPDEYIEFHRNAAQESLAKDFAAYTVHRQYMDDDGWMDGMKFLHVVIEDRSGNLFKIKWSDQGSWMQQTPGGGGWGIFRP